MAQEVELGKLQCVRCLRRQGDVDRAHMFLCADCASLHQERAFRGSAPVYALGVGDGRCEYCDAPRDLTYRQWLLCGYCTRVVQSYRMGHLSAHFALARLRQMADAAGLTTLFEEADPVSVQATSRRGGPRERATRLDLIARADRSGAPSFWLEVKTGPGSVDEMSAFQLDCSDCDDITNAMAVSGMPSVLLHSQMAKVPEPPTVRLVGKGLWWTDVFAFAEAFQEVKPRRGNERKLAAYFEASCFRPLESLAEYVASRTYARHAERLKAHGAPALYCAPVPGPAVRTRRKQMKLVTDEEGDR